MDPHFSIYGLFLLPDFIILSTTSITIITYDLYPLFPFYKKPMSKTESVWSDRILCQCIPQSCRMQIVSYFFILTMKTYEQS